MMIESKNKNKLKESLDNDIQSHYQKLMMEGRFHEMEKIKERIGVKLKVGKRDAQALYRNFLENFDLSNFFRLNELTEIEPRISQKDADIVFEKMLMRSEATHIPYLSRMIKKYPRFEEKLLQTAYKGMLRMGDMRIVKRLKYLTGVKPNKEVINYIYNDILEKNDTFSCCITSTLGNTSPMKNTQFEIFRDEMREMYVICEEYPSAELLKYHNLTKEQIFDK